MRLRLSIAVLVILACFLLEASATTSNRNTEAIKENSRSTNSKDVRYSKNKPVDYRKKESGKEQELEKKKKQRRDAHGNQKIKSNEVFKNNKYERGGKSSYEEQNRMKSHKHNKLDRGVENFKNGKSNVKSNTEKSNKSKRTLELEQPEDLDIHGKEGASDNVDSRYTSKKMSDNTLRKKSESKGADCATAEGDDVNNIELESNSHPSEARKIKSPKKNQVKLDKREDSELTKTHKRSGKSDSMCKENVVSRDSESEKKIQIIEKSDLDNLSENGNHLEGEILMKRKKCKTEKLKHNKKSSKKSSTTGSKKKCRKYDESAQVLHEEENSAEKLEDHESGSCDMKTQSVPKRNKVHAEELEYFADDIVKSTIVNSDERDVEKNSFENSTNEQEIDSENLHEADGDINDEENCSQENWLK
ncbi:protein starmaker-like [Athalia rosae]|uniref:protein starmaker-like n=1 Tax=Athalia rosae TaxID=37344 RepID=UPI0020332EE3|nr:protein starmaker-like [Athalia rosae]